MRISARRFLDHAPKYLGRFVLLPGFTERRVLENVATYTGSPTIFVKTRLNDDRTETAIEPDDEVIIY